MSSAKADCEALLEAVVPFAERMLREHGEFFPYGGALDPHGGITNVAGYDGREQPPSEDIIALIKEAFVEGARAGSYVATALVYDVRITVPTSREDSDAIAVSLNHRDNYSVVVLFPYQLSDGELKLGATIAKRGEADVFVSS